MSSLRSSIGEGVTERQVEKERRNDIASSLELLHQSSLPRINGGSVLDVRHSLANLSTMKIAQQAKLIDQYHKICHKNQKYYQEHTLKKRYLDVIESGSVRKQFNPAGKVQNQKNNLDGKESSRNPSKSVMVHQSNHGPGYDTTMSLGDKYLADEPMTYGRLPSIDKARKFLAPSLSG